MTTSIFETKTEYLNFRAAFAAACNDARRKSTMKKEYCESSLYKEQGWLRSEHFLLLNILCGRPIHSGFTLITNKIKLENGAYINAGLYEAAYRLKRVVKDVAVIREGHCRWSAERAELRVAKFLEPFGDTLSVAKLGMIDVPEVNPIESNFGVGIQIAADIKDGKDITCANIQDLYEVA